ncbi:MAG: hypothetical protein R3F56_18765 [Planctomycetota bacterium]
MAQRQTWIVGSGGFPTLQAAFDAPQVADGDLVVVRPGTYAGAVLTKGLLVRGDPGAVLDDGLPMITPPAVLQVTGLTAAQAVEIAGFEVRHGQIHAQNCAGPVVLDDLRFVQNPPNMIQIDVVALQVDGCPWVSLTRADTQFRVVRATTSNLALEDCSIVSRDGWFSQFLIVWPQGPALEVDHCSLSLASTSLRGSSLGGSAAIGCGSPALVATDSFIGVAATCVLQAGGGPIGGGCSIPALEFQGRGAVVVDPAASLIGSNSPPVGGIVPVTRAVPELGATALTTGSQASGVVVASPGDLFAVLLGVARAPVFFPPLDGGLGLDLSQPLLTVAAGVLSGASTNWSLAVPSQPDLLGVMVGLQSVAGTGTLVLSNPLVRLLR